MGVFVALMDDNIVRLNGDNVIPSVATVEH